MTILSKVMSRRVPGGICMEEGTADTAPARRHMWHSSRCVFAGGEFRTDPVINGCYQSHDRLLTRDQHEPPACTGVLTKAFREVRFILEPRFRSVEAP